MNYLSSKFNFDRTENKLSKLYNQTKHKIDFLDLTSSNPTTIFKYNATEIQSILVENNSFPYLPDPKGLLVSRQALVDFYHRRGRHLNADNFILTTGTSEAMSYITKAICDYNSEILLPTPGYPLYDFIFKLENVTPKYYSLNSQESSIPNKLNWKIDFEELENTLSKKTKAIVIVQPHNPIGSILTFEDSNRLKNFVNKNNLTLIIDEVFADYFENYYSVNPFKDTNCLYLNGISKTLALPQFKLSWIYISGNIEFTNQVKDALEIISDSYLSVNIPIQLGLKKLLSISEIMQNKIKERINNNCTFITKEFQFTNSFNYFLPDGGWYIILKFKNIFDDEELASKLLLEKSTYVFPGYIFDLNNGCHLILSLITPEKIFSKGVRRILSLIENY